MTVFIDYDVDPIISHANLWKVLVFDLDIRAPYYYFPIFWYLSIISCTCFLANDIILIFLLFIKSFYLRLVI